MQKNYFKDKRILITGISGFVGSFLSNKLKSIGAEVYGLTKLEGNKNYLNADILDFENLDSFIRNKKIQICYHLAGKSLVEDGQNNPYETFKVNIQGTLNILESSRKNKLERIIIASTTHVYGNNKLPYLEDYTPRPTRPYETSKACNDLIAQSYAETFNLPVLIPRFVNIYGPGDLNFTRLIPKTIKSVLLGKSPQMWGGEALREYLFIDDAVEAYLKLGSSDLNLVGKNKVFNFGSGDRISVKDLMERIIEITETSLQIEKIKEERDLEIRSQYVSSVKAKKILDWESSVNLEEGLKRTVSWYTEYFNHHE